MITDVAAMMKIIHIDPLLRAQLEHNTELIAQGWQRRFTVDEQRSKEVVELYTQLGFEVRTEPVAAVEQDVQFHTIYTRRPKA